MALKDNFKDQIPEGGKRLYQVIDGSTGAIIHNNIRIARSNGNTQEGDKYGANEVNEERKVINQLSNPNLLINGDFKIWQHGIGFENVTEYIYTADRWMLYGSAQNKMMIKKETKGASIIGTVVQKLELCLRGEIVTISAKIDGHVFKTITNAINDTWKSYPVNEDGKNIVFAIQTTSANITIIEMYLQNTNSQIPYHVEWVKIECGEIATPFVPRPWAEELMLCQRYYEIQFVTTSFTEVHPHTTGYILAVFCPKVEKRIKPTFKFMDISSNIGVLTRFDVRNNYNNEQGRIYSNYGHQTYEIISDTGTSAYGIKATVMMDAEIY